VLAPGLRPGGLYLGLDRDAHALAVARERLQDLGDVVRLRHGRFGDLEAALAAAGFPRLDGLLLDIGVSSMQFDTPGRGFAFDRPGPLDMRMDPEEATDTAADLVNDLPERDLADLIFRLGEERLSRRIARAIAEERRRAPIRTTDRLADVVARAVPRSADTRRLHPATRTFQALRIAVNDELGELERALEAVPRVLAPGGRAAVISFHSLEDRLVKHAFREGAKAGRLAVVTKKPVVAGEDEVRANRRARSAKLRVAERPGEGRAWGSSAT